MSTTTRKVEMDTFIELTDEEVVSRITGLPLPRIEYLKNECGMPVNDPDFSNWAVNNFELLFEEQKKYFEQLLFPRELGPEPAEPAA